MKVGIAQINTVAGDFPGNARRLLQAYRECLDQDADWVVTPALSLAGGETEARQIGSCLQALDYLGSETRATPLLVGHLSEDGDNAVSLLVNGAVLATFTEPAVIDWRGNRIAIVPGDGVLPTAELVLQLTRVVGEMRFSQVAGTPHVVCNAVGGDHEWVYAGRSVVRSSAGQVISRLASFAEECRVVDIGSTVDDPEELNRAGDLLTGWSLGLADFVRKQGYLGVTVLLDGREESLLLAKLARRVLGEEAVEVIALTPEHGCDPASVRVVDGSEIRNAVSASLDGPPDISEMAAFILSTAAHQSGYLPLLSATRADLLGGDFGFVEGLAPFGELSQRDLVALADAGGFAFAPDSSIERIVCAISDEGFALEELLERGYPETEVLRVQRRLDRARFRTRPPVLRFELLIG